MKELYDDNEHMTNAELLKSAVDRTTRLGAKGLDDSVVLLEDEIRRYRERMREYEIAMDDYREQMASLKNDLFTTELQNDYLKKKLQTIPEDDTQILECQQFDEDDTVIIVKSKQKVSNCEIYFQEG